MTTAKEFNGTSIETKLVDVSELSAVEFVIPAGTPGDLACEILGHNGLVMTHGKTGNLWLMPEDFETTKA